MLSEEELAKQVQSLEDGPVTWQACERLAALYIIRDARAPSEEQPAPVVFRTTGSRIAIEGDSEFAQAIRGKEQSAVWPVLDELMKTVQAVYPRLYNATIDSLSSK